MKIRIKLYDDDGKKAFDEIVEVPKFMTLAQAKKICAEMANIPDHLELARKITQAPGYLDDKPGGYLA